MEKINVKDLEQAVWRTVGHIVQQLDRDPQYTVKKLQTLNFFRQELGLPPLAKLDKGTDPVEWLEKEIKDRDRSKGQSL